VINTLRSPRVGTKRVERSIKIPNLELFDTGVLLEGRISYIIGYIRITEGKVGIIVVARLIV
jgi:hypothetical protein